MFESWSGRHLFNDLQLSEFQIFVTAPYLLLFTQNCEGLEARAVDIVGDLECHNTIT